MMTLEQAWERVQSKAFSQNDKDAEAIFVIAKAASENLASISSCLTELILYKRQEFHR